MAGLEAESVRSESNHICFKLGNPRGLWRSLSEKLGERKGLCYLAK